MKYWDAREAHVTVDEAIEECRISAIPDPD